MDIAVQGKHNKQTLVYIVPSNKVRFHYQTNKKKGNYTLRGTAAPLLHDVLVQSAKKVPTPDPSEVALGRKTFFDTWQNRSQDPAHPEFPRYNQFQLFLNP